VNTDLATLAGGEMFAEYDSSPWLTTFATLSFVEGRDHSRDGDFATEEAGAGGGSRQVSGLSRGSFSGLAGADEEPLPNMGPLEARVGLRLHEASRNPNWGLELTARIVDNQDRVATSLLESETPGFTIWDIRGYMRTRPGLLLVAGIENLTNKQYREYLDFRSQNVNARTVFQPGVNFYFGSQLSY
jgi:outer membrane receptor protein involved in Fe transport